jgi:hypothetical protein
MQQIVWRNKETDVYPFAYRKRTRTRGNEECSLTAFIKI